MKIPDGYTEEEVLEIILGVIEKQYKKYKFNIYDYDDMYQEAFIICEDALNRFDSSKGKLQNFLSNNLSRRLINFLRDNTRNPQMIFDIDTIPTEERDNLITFDEQDSEILEQIDSRIPAKQRADYLKIISGQKLSKLRRDKLRHTINDILNN